jgi:hypothetical protein
MGVLSSTSWFIIHLFIIFFVLVSRIGRTSTTKCTCLMFLYWELLRSLIHHMFRPDWPSSGVYSSKDTAAHCNAVFLLQPKLT